MTRRAWIGVGLAAFAGSTIACGGAGSDPIVGRYVPPTSGGLSDIVVRDGYAYVAQASVGVRVVDVHDPANPVGVSVISTPVTSFGAYLAVGGTSLYVSGFGSPCFSSFDITVPTAATPLSTFSPTGCSGGGMLVDGQMLLAADGVFGLRVFDPVDPAALGIGAGLVAEPTSLGQPQDVAVNGNVAVVISQVGNIWTVDLSATPHVVLDQADGLSPLTARVAVADGMAYVANDLAGLAVFDVSDPANITLVREVSNSLIAQDVAIDGNRLYVANQSASSTGVRVFDRTDPSNPIRIGDVETALPHAVAVDASHVYVATSDDLVVTAKTP